jgi:hypothetical protein
MAKESMKAREVKRKTVAKYAEKRKALLDADFVGFKSTKNACCS